MNHPLTVSWPYNCGRVLFPTYQSNLRSSATFRSVEGELIGTVKLGATVGP